MKRKILLALMAVALVCACQNDDTDFSEYINGSQSGASGTSTIYITYNGTSVDVTGDTKGYVTTNGAAVTVNASTSTDSLLLVLSGSTTNGSLLINRQKQFGIQLNGVSINNPTGPAINNQCGKALYIEVASGTTNNLSDGTTYNETVSYQQKGTLFSEGQIYFSGTGSLNVTGNCKNAIACDDYIVIDEANLSATATADNGIKVNDGLWINGGTLNIDVTANGGRGIKCDSTITISGGSTTIRTTGNCKIETSNGVADTTSAACIKCDYDFIMTAGTLDMKSSGDGGKGLNCSTKVLFSGGTLTATTTGDNNNAKPKAVKGDGGITISGGQFKATVNKSWACDNGSESDNPEDHLTVLGSPKASTITKKSVVITY